MVASPLYAAVISILLWATVSDGQPLSAPLTIGSPSPKLTAMKYVRGETITELSAGTIYVVEFSGTNCIPCIKCIPHLNELHKKHANVVFISVFGEAERVVRDFLGGKGKEIAYSVAVDPSGRMWREWAEPAGAEGIPQVFIVGKDKKIAWIGHPADLAEPLARVVTGTFDPQEYSLRLRVEQEATLRLKRMREREEKGCEEYERINDMARAGQLADALTQTEKALAAYQDCPKSAERLRMMRVFLLANLPGKREEAFKLATELAIEAKMSGREFVMVGTAKVLLSTAERTRDTRFIDLALPLLGDPSHDPDLRGRPDELQDARISVLRLQGWAYHLRGDKSRATGSIRDAIAMIRDLKPPPDADAKKFAEDVRRRLEAFQTILKEYSEEPGFSPTDRR